MNYEKQIYLRAFASNCHRLGQIGLRTRRSRDYVNILFTTGGEFHDNFTCHPDDARALRDALIELYPVEGAAARPKVTYEVEFDGNGIERVEVGVRETRTRIGATYSREHAEKVAAALNAQEAANG